MRPNCPNWQRQPAAVLPRPSRTGRTTWAAAGLSEPNKLRSHAKRTCSFDRTQVLALKKMRNRTIYYLTWPTVMQLATRVIGLTFEILCASGKSLYAGCGSGQIGADSCCEQGHCKDLFQQNLGNIICASVLDGPAASIRKSGGGQKKRSIEPRSHRPDGESQRRREGAKWPRLHWQDIAALPKTGSPETSGPR